MNMKAILAFAAVSALSLTAAFAAKPYPLKTCLVSGEKLGSMGKVITKVHDGQEIKFCCKPCAGKFAKNPAKYLSKLR